MYLSFTASREQHGHESAVVLTSRDGLTNQLLRQTTSSQLRPLLLPPLTTTNIQTDLSLSRLADLSTPTRTSPCYTTQPIKHRRWVSLSLRDAQSILQSTHSSP